MSLIKCPECHREVSSHAPHCPHCGVQIVNNIKRCPICSTFVLMEETQCPQCHAKFIANATTPAIQESEVQGSKFKRSSSEVQSTSEESRNPEVSEFRNSEPSTSKKSSHFGLWLLLILLLLLVGGGVYYYFHQREVREVELYAKLAAGCQDPENFKDFLNEFPNSKHTDSVTLLLHNLEVEISTWQKSEASLDIKALQAFVKSYPKSAFTVRAKQLIDSLDWKTAERAANIRAFETYMANHDSGNYYTVARQKRDSLIKVNDSIVKARKAAELAKQKAAEAVKKKAAARHKTTTKSTRRR